MKTHNNNTNDPDLSTTTEEEEGTEPDDSGDRPAYCRDELVPKFDTERKTYKQGEDATMRGDISVLQADYKSRNTPVEVNFVSPSGKKYGPHDVEPEFFTECGFTFKFVIRNVRELGRWKVSAVYSPVDVAVETQFEVVTKEKYNNSTLGVSALGDRCWDMYDEEKPIESYPEPCRSYFEEYFSGISPPGGAFDS